MAKDWAEECADRHVDKELATYSFPDGVDDLRRLLTGAIREALEKAAETARSVGKGPITAKIAWDCANAIRVLGAK